MKKDAVKLIMILLGAFLYTIIFWNEKLGVNAILFDVFIIACVFYLYPTSAKNKTSLGIAAGHLVSAAMVLVHNTILSKIGFSITLLLFVSFSQYIHRSVWYAGASVIVNYLLAIPNFFHQFSSVKGENKKPAGFSKPIRMLLIPIILVTVFIIIYALGNVVFSSIATGIVTAVQRWFENVFDWFSIPRFLFFLSGILVTSGLILTTNGNYFSVVDVQQKDALSRRKHDLKKWKKSAFAGLLSVLIGKASKGMMAIKSEFTIGLISFVLLNFLLLLINVIDVKYVWLGFTFNKDVSLSAYVHQGAGLLILSIILAMVLLLFFFRGNLNFYKKNTWIRYSAYLWIFQNLFLVVSVFIRDYYYISHYGLAYKRIGLLFFLAMVMTGLITVFLKIHNVKTTYYLVRINAWAAIVLLILATTVHWDYAIAQYNLERKSSVPLDVPFLLSLSDKTLPLFEMNKDVFEKDNHRWIYYHGIEMKYNAVDFYEFRIKEFLDKQNQYTWLSWNAADTYVKQALNASQFSSLR